MLASVIPQEDQAPDGSRVALWSFGGPPGHYHCSASANLGLRGSPVSYADANADFELRFDKSRVLRGEVAPAPADGIQAQVRLISKSTVPVDMGLRMPAIEKDGKFELAGISPGDSRVAVMLVDTPVKELRLHVFEIGADENDVTLALDAAQVPGRYRIIESEGVRAGLLRIECEGWTVFRIHAVPPGFVFNLPAGEHRFWVAPAIQTEGTAGADLHAEVEARVGAPGPGGVRDVTYEFAE